MKYKHPFYNPDNYPHFVKLRGNWAIWSSGSGHLAAIPTNKASRIGCRASHFGDWRHLKSIEEHNPDHEIVLQIQEWLSGVEWTPNTLQEIAELLENNGYHIEDID